MFFLRCLDGTNVQDLLPRCVSQTLIRQREKSYDHQRYPQDCSSAHTPSTLPSWFLPCPFRSIQEPDAANSGSPKHMAHQRYKKKNQKDVKQNLRDPCRGHGNSRKAKHRCNEGHDKKSQCPT